jgi:indole-3-glycerol phosphate synthase
MKIPPNAIIADSKITRYLLVLREQDDKSKFLAQAGFTQDNPEQLTSAIRQLADAVEAVEDTTNEYGIFYRVEGELIGINNRNLSVITIWLNRKIDGRFQFITLKPKKEKSTNV